jgi:hypothetical protein
LMLASSCCTCLPKPWIRLCSRHSSMSSRVTDAAPTEQGRSSHKAWTGDRTGNVLGRVRSVVDERNQAAARATQQHSGEKNMLRVGTESGHQKRQGDAISSDKRGRRARCGANGKRTWCSPGT